MSISMSGSAFLSDFKHGPSEMRVTDIRVEQNAGIASRHFCKEIRPRQMGRGADVVPVALMSSEGTAGKPADTRITLAVAPL